MSKFVSSECQLLPMNVSNWAGPTSSRVELDDSTVLWSVSRAIPARENENKENKFSKSKKTRKVICGTVGKYRVRNQSVKEVR